MTATPYRLGEGYIFSYWPDDSPVAEDECTDPYYLKMLYQITAEELTERGYLTPMHADPEHIAGYDTSGIKRHTERDPAFIAAFEQNRSKTLAIVDDFLPILRNRKGVMVFAATVQHAKEIQQLIPSSRVVTGDTPKEERAATVRDFKAQKFQYLINVGIYTRGFDATHVDAIVVMRSTDSAALFQQIIGRGLRLHDGKEDCLLLDYADNIESHQLEDSLFKPQIKAKRKGNSIPVDVICPDCSYTNEFSKRKNDDDLPMDDYGYLVDLAGNRVQTPDGKELPGHYGRRCFGFSLVAGKAQRCEYRWSVKVCDECGHENDVAARKCEKCKTELVSPEEKLQETFKRIKKDPAAQSTDKVLSFSASHHVSNSGNHTVKCVFQTEYRSFDAYFMPDSTNNFVRAKYEMLSNAVFGKVAPDAATFAKYVHLGQSPQTVTYYKNKQSGFWEVTGFNKPEDKPEDFAA
jgi:DNA repair protein RadD